MSGVNKQSTQQYELKLGIINHSSLKTTQLIQFIQNQANQFLQHDLPQYIKNEEKFINVMENFSCQNQEISEYSFQEYVGLLLIYSTSSEQSYQYFLKNVQTILNLQISDLFLIVIEMDNSDKQTNIIGNQGQRFCNRNSLQYVKLNLYNSEDLINVINRNLYELIQNYYYPNQQDQGSKQQSSSNLPSNSFKNIESIHKQQKSRSSSKQKSQNFLFSYQGNNPTIKAFNYQNSPSKRKVDEMMSHAVQLRKSRQKQILMEQEQIDESIANVENVLNNINNRIREKLDSGWFSAMTKNLYLTSEKNNQNFSKIKLTQEFLDEIPKKPKKPYSSVVQSRYSDLLNQSSKQFTLNFNTLKFNSNILKNPILKIVLFFSRDNVVELQVYENSTYQQLALIALRRMGIRETMKNQTLLIEKIKKRIEGFSKQLQRAIKINQEKKIQQRSFIKGNVSSDQ